MMEWLLIISFQKVVTWRSRLEIFTKIIIYLIIMHLLKITAPTHEHIFERTNHWKVP